MVFKVGDLVKFKESYIAEIYGIDTNLIYKINKVNIIDSLVTIEREDGFPMLCPRTWAYTRFEHFLSASNKKKTIKYNRLL